MNHSSSPSPTPPSSRTNDSTVALYAFAALAFPPLSRSCSLRFSYVGSVARSARRACGAALRGRR